jgi:epoxyqueuosine reductase
MEVSKQIKSKAASLGFMECAIIPADFLSEEKERLQSWLDNNMHGEMGYMARNIDKRLDPRLLVENAKSVIVVLQNYFPGEGQRDSSAPVLSKYAYGKDYHYVIKNKLKKMLSFIQEKIKNCHGRPFVDSAPVLERAWARRAGLGWIGKNSNLISASHGSFFFIGELIVDVILPYDNPEPVADHCGNCTRCIDACPSKAIVAGRVIDARKCISYQTTEMKGMPGENQDINLKNRVFGCDICQDVCPWNSGSKPHNDPDLKPSLQLLELSREEWHNMDISLFNRLFKNSAVKRTGFPGLKRNLSFCCNPEETGNK